MIFQLQAADLALVLDLKQQQLAESACGSLPGEKIKPSLARYQQLYREGRCIHFAFRADQTAIAMAGAFFLDETPFLSVRMIRYALLVDEYVFPAFRGQGIEGSLRDALLVEIARQGAILRTEFPSNAARLAAFGAGNPRL